MPETPVPAHESLARRSLWALGLRLGALLLLVLLCTAALLRHSLQAERSAALQALVRERAAAASAQMLQLEQAQQALRAEFLRRQVPGSAAEPGVRQALATELVQRFGPTWPLLATLYLFGPEDFRVGDEPGRAAARAPELPLDGWSAPFLDPLTQGWLISRSTPIHAEAGLLARVGSDLRLGSLLGPLQAELLPGVRGGLFGPHGEALLATAAPPELSETLAAATRKGLQQWTQSEGGELLAAARIEGPGWWLVARQPDALQIPALRQLLAVLLLLALAALVLELWMLRRLLGRQLLQPLQQFQQRVHALSRGEPGALAALAAGEPPLPEGRRDELGQFARTLRRAAQRLHDDQQELENRLAQRHELLGDAQLELRGTRQQLEDLQKALQIQHHAVVDAYAELERLSETDKLTGLSNRRSLEERLNRMVKAWGERRGHPPRHAFVRIAIDEFEALNLRYGQHVGSLVLGAVATRLTLAQREGDCLARWGDEDFTVLIPAEEPQAAQACAHRLRAALSKHPVALPWGEVLQISVSVGFACWPLDPQRPQPWALSLQLAHVALALAQQEAREHCLGLLLPAGLELPPEDVDRSAVEELLRQGRLQLLR